MAKISVLTKDFDDSLLNRTDPIVYLPKVAAPFTTVVKRALMTDLANDLLPRFGIERILPQQLIEMQGESGPSGEKVFKPANDIHDMIRFVGGGWSLSNIGSGGQQITSDGAHYIEISFYGTGLNILNRGSSSTTAAVDGGAAGANFVTAGGAAILDSRNYNRNEIQNAVSGLTAGFHTVKLVSSSFRFYGFEILNTNTTLQLLPGRSYLGGKRLYKAAASTDAYNSNFESGTLGTKGGHVVVYQKSDGTVAKAVQPTNASQATMTSTDHTNEVLIRTYSVFEFGAGLSGDYSQFASGAYLRAFTLDDGTTTLVTSATGDTINVNGIGMDGAGGTSFTTFTFIGTGLDVFFNQAGTFGVSNVSIDGAAGIALVNSQNTPLWIKIVSGLPYGTHTCKISVTAGGSADLFILAYNVYGPSKPSLPSGAIEIADYYLLGNYSTGGAGLDTVANGVIRKQNIHEFFYSGTYLSVGFAPGVLEASGYEVQTQVVSSFAEYIFFGTGFEYRSRANTVYSATNTVSLQFLSGSGSLLTLNSTNFPGLTAASLSGSTFTYASGNLAQNTSNQIGSGFSITGLTLGTYRLRITAGTTAGMLTDSLDVITPVHSPKNQQPGDLQNTLPIGSCAIGDSRKFSSTSVKTLANWAQARGITSSPTTTSTSFVPVPDLSVTIKTSGNPVVLNYYVRLVADAAARNMQTAFYVDGVQVGSTKAIDTASANFDAFNTDNIIVALAAGTHKIDVYWLTTAGTATAKGISRNLTAREI